MFADVDPKTFCLNPQAMERASKTLLLVPGEDVLGDGVVLEMSDSVNRVLGVSAQGRLGRKVMDRCNLTVLLEPASEDLPAFLADNEVCIVASLPCYGPENVERQRGRGVFDTVWDHPPSRPEGQTPANAPSRRSLEPA